MELGGALEGIGITAATITAVVVAYEKALKPLVLVLWRWVRGWSGIAGLGDTDTDHEARLITIETSLNRVLAAVVPNNGDQRTISDRVDSLRHWQDEHARADSHNFSEIGRCLAVLMEDVNADPPKIYTEMSEEVNT